MTYWSIDLTDVFIDQAVQGEKKEKKLAADAVSATLSGRAALP